MGDKATLHIKSEHGMVTLCGETLAQGAAVVDREHSDCRACLEQDQAGLMKVSVGGHDYQVELRFGQMRVFTLEGEFLFAFVIPKPGDDQIDWVHRIVASWRHGYALGTEAGKDALARHLRQVLGVPSVDELDNLEQQVLG